MWENPSSQSPLGGCFICLISICVSGWPRLLSAQDTLVPLTHLGRYSQTQRTNGHSGMGQADVSKALYVVAKGLELRKRALERLKQRCDALASSAATPAVVLTRVALGSDWSELADLPNYALSTSMDTGYSCGAGGEALVVLLRANASPAPCSSSKLIAAKLPYPLLLYYKYCIGEVRLHQNCVQTVAFLEGAFSVVLVR